MVENTLYNIMGLMVAVIGIMATVFGFALRWERRLSRMEGKLNALHRRVDTAKKPRDRDDPGEDETEED